MDRVPALRFPEFSGEWEDKRLGDISLLTSSKRVYLSDYVDNGIPFYRGKEITELKQKKVPDDILYISVERYEDFREKYGVPKTNDILITAVGTLGNVLRIRNNHPFYFKDGNLIWLKNICENSNFLEVLLTAFNSKILKSAIGSSQKALTIVELNKLKFYFPSLPEQQKIAKFLTTVDTKIEQLTKKKTLLEQYKKGVSQKLFSQEIRFKPVNSKQLAVGSESQKTENYPDWVEKKLGAVLKIGSGKDYKHLNSGDIPVYGTGGYMTSVNDYLYDGESVCIGRKGTIDKPRLINGKFWTVDTLFYTHSYKSSIPKFIYSIFQQINWIKYNEASGVPSLSKSTIETIKMNIPSLPEQQKIANFLSSIDTKIEQATKQLDQTKQFKKALLQQMFV